jgi:hypothetical protein
MKYWRVKKGEKIVQKIAGNERSWAIYLISEINMLLKTKSLSIKKAGGEFTVSFRAIRMFPDLLLYSDEGMTRFVQGWELKMPDTPITDANYILDAQRKAKILGLNSFIIWNFNDCRLYVKNSHQEYRILKTWSSGLSHIDTRDKVDLYQEDWKNVLEEVILDLNEYFTTGKMVGNLLDRVISENLMTEILLECKGITADYIKLACCKNAILESEIYVWWQENKTEYLSDELDMFRAYSKVLILHWTNKFLFAHLIKRHHRVAQKVEEIRGDTSLEEAGQIFQQITDACGFHHIFSPFELRDLLPESAFHVIKEFNIFLTLNGIHTLNQEVLQNTLERTVKLSRREVNGQFTTPPILAEILSRITVIDKTKPAIDPCCGTGSIAKSIFNLKRKVLSPTDAYKTTWASDKYSFPLQIANISLTSVEAMDIPCLVFQKNVFDLFPDEEILVTGPKTGEPIKINTPQFESVVSNLPFVAFEIFSEDEKQKIEDIRKRVKQNTDILLDGRSDLYAYVIFSLWETVGIGGQIGVLVSNSWLGTEWGKKFRSALGYYFKFRVIITSSGGRWFDNANIVTTILVLEKKEISSPCLEEETSFSCVKTSLTFLKENSEEKENLIHSVLANQAINREILEMNTYKRTEIRDLEEMNLSWNALFFNAKWLLELKDILRPIKEFFTGVRGERRGWDPLFYPQSGHGIESAYIKRVLKSSRSIDTLHAKTDSDAFCCSESLEALRNKGHQGALRWIEQFENGLNGTGKKLTEVLKRSNMHWYEMEDSTLVDLVSSLNPDKRLFVAKFERPSFINQRLIGLKKINDSVDIHLCHALLNSAIGMFYIEAIGFGRGLGALDINKSNFSKMYILDPRKLSRIQRNEILEAFEPLLHRSIKPTQEELLLKDRINFDQVIMRAYGVEGYYSRIKESLLKMQDARLSVR